MTEPTVDQLRAGSADDAAVQLYAEKLVRDHAELIARFGAAQYAAGDLVPRGIITTKQELNAFLALASRPAADEVGTLPAFSDAELVAARVTAVTVDSADCQPGAGRCRGCAELIGNYHQLDCPTEAATYAGLEL